MAPILFPRNIVIANSTLRAATEDRRRQTTRSEGRERRAMHTVPLPPAHSHSSLCTCVVPANAERHLARRPSASPRHPSFPYRRLHRKYSNGMRDQMQHQWRRSVVKYEVQGPSGQAIKLFQITPYVNDFQTLNNSGS